MRKLRATLAKRDSEVNADLVYCEICVGLRVQSESYPSNICRLINANMGQEGRGKLTQNCVIFFFYF